MNKLNLKLLVIFISVVVSFQGCDLNSGSGGSDSIEVTFNSNNEAATGEMGSLKVDSEGAVTLTANSFILENYTFSSWNTSADGSGVTYRDGQAIKGLTKSITLFAQWLHNGIANKPDSKMVGITANGLAFYVNIHTEEVEYIEDLRSSTATRLTGVTSFSYSADNQAFITVGATVYKVNLITLFAEEYTTISSGSIVGSVYYRNALYLNVSRTSGSDIVKVYFDSATDTIVKEAITVSSSPNTGGITVSNQNFILGMNTNSYIQIIKLSALDFTAGTLDPADGNSENIVLTGEAKDSTPLAIGTILSMTTINDVIYLLDTNNRIFTVKFVIDVIPDGSNDIATEVYLVDSQYDLVAIGYNLIPKK